MIVIGISMRGAIGHGRARLRPSRLPGSLWEPRLARRLALPLRVRRDGCFVGFTGLGGGLEWRVYAYAVD